MRPAHYAPPRLRLPTDHGGHGQKTGQPLREKKPKCNLSGKQAFQHAPFKKATVRRDAIPIPPRFYWLFHFLGNISDRMLTFFPKMRATKTARHYHQNCIAGTDPEEGDPHETFVLLLTSVDGVLDYSYWSYCSAASCRPFVRHNSERRPSAVSGTDSSNEELLANKRKLSSAKKAICLPFPAVFDGAGTLHAAYVTKSTMVLLITMIYSSRNDRDKCFPLVGRSDLTSFFDRPNGWKRFAGSISLFLGIYHGRSGGICRASRVTTRYLKEVLGGILDLGVPYRCLVVRHRLGGLQRSVGAVPRSA
jgi:hypothetical protein